MKPLRNIPLSALVLILGVMLLCSVASLVLSLEANLAAGAFAGAVAGTVVFAGIGFLLWVVRELERNEERLRVIVESAFDGVITADEFGIILTVNPSVTSLFGYRPGQLAGEHLSVLFSSAHGEPDDRETLADFLDREHLAPLGESHVVRGLRQDGRQFQMDMSVNHVQLGSEVFFTVMVRDVTEHVAAQKVLRQAKEELEKRVKERTASLEETNSRLEEEILKRKELIQELQVALSEIKTLSGMLPICAACKKIRDDKGYWNQIEVFIRDHSNAEFSHGICPDCMKELYPGVGLPASDPGEA